MRKAIAQATRSRQAQMTVQVDQEITSHVHYFSLLEVRTCRSSDLTISPFFSKFRGI